MTNQEASLLQMFHNDFKCFEITTIEQLYRSGRRMLWGWLLYGACLGVGLAQEANPVSRNPRADARGEVRAELIPRQYTTLAAEIGARIQALPVSEGGRFRKGDVLVAFDCSIQQAQLQRSQAELAGAEQTLKANVELLKLNSVGKLELELSESAADKARAEVRTNAAVLDKCTISAPFSGRIAEQKARAQQYVQAGQMLMDIIDDSALELEFLVPSKWLVWLRTGLSVKVRIDETRKTYPARFIRIGARADPVNQTIKVAAVIDGRFPELIAGMSGVVLVTPPNTNND